MLKIGKKLCGEDVSKMFLRNVCKYIYRTTRCNVPKIWSYGSSNFA